MTPVAKNKETVNSAFNQKELRKEAFLNSRRQERDLVMLEFQRSTLEMTKQFLRSQETVMLAYLKGARNQTGSLEPVLYDSACHIDLEPLTSQSSAEKFADLTHLKPASPILLPEVPAGKKESNPNVSLENFSPEKKSDDLNGASKPAAPRAFSSSELVEALVEIVSQRTGYPPEMLDPNLDLEADLGIDSIKRIEILNSFRKLLPESAQASLEDGIEKLAGVKSLQGIIDWISTDLDSVLNAGPLEGSNPMGSENKLSFAKV